MRQHKGSAGRIGERQSIVSAFNHSPAHPAQPDARGNQRAVKHFKVATLFPPWTELFSGREKAMLRVTVRMCSVTWCFMLAVITLFTWCRPYTFASVYFAVWKHHIWDHI